MAKPKLTLVFIVILCLLELGLAYHLIFFEQKYFGGFCELGLVVMNIILLNSYLKQGSDKNGND